LDSSAVFCVADHLRRKDQLLAPEINGYTLAFNDDSEANELVYALTVGEYLGVAIKEVSPYVPELSWYSEHARAHPGQPAFPNGVMLHGLGEQASQQGSRVILNGIGGDEWVSGSRSYYAEELAQQNWAQIYRCFRADSEAFGIQQAMAWSVRYGCLPLMPPSLQDSLRMLVRKVRGNGVSEHYWLSKKMRKVIGQRREQFSQPIFQKVRTAGQRELLSLHFAAFRDIGREGDEQRNAGYGMETRRPLDTPEFVQFAFSTPERLRLRGDIEKYIHRQALQGYMPQYVLERKNKAGFATVFRGYLDRLEGVLTKDIPDTRTEWVTSDGVKQLYKTYRERPRLGWPAWILWAIYGCDRALPRK
jgi:asparagine synthase (glutamine-hydrolysing)